MVELKTWKLLSVALIVLLLGGVIFFRSTFPRIIFYERGGRSRSEFLSIYLQPEGALERLVAGKSGVTLSSSGEKIYGITAYDHGIRHGLDLDFEDGQPKALLNWKKGIKHGLCMRWDQDQNLVEQGNYQDGQKHGLWTEWYADGLLRSRTVLTNGVICGVTWGDDEMEALSNEIFTAWRDDRRTAKSRYIRERIIRWVKTGMKTNEVVALLGPPARVRTERLSFNARSQGAVEKADVILFWEYDVDDQEVLCVQIDAALTHVVESSLWRKQTLYDERDL